MKTVLFRSLCAIVVWTLTGETFAQITVTSTHVAPFFTPGVTHPGYGLADTMVNVGTASSNAQTWNFSTLAIGDTSQREVLFPGQVPFGGNFPQATAVDFHYDEAPPGDSCTHYIFFRLDSSAISQVGQVKVGPCDGGPDTMRFWHHSPFQRWLALPATYGTAWTSVDSADEGTRVTITTLNNSMDAFGTLILSGGSYGALRWKRDETRLQYEGGILTQRVRSISYFWLTTESVLFSVDLQDTNQTSGTVPIEGGGYYVSTPVSVQYHGGTAPSEYILRQNFPNPFNPTTTIEFSLPEKNFVTLKVFNMLGQEVATLVSQNLGAGTYSTVWDASTVSSGVYYYELRAGSFIETKKLLLLR